MIYEKTSIDGNLGEKTIERWREEQMQRDVINQDNAEARTNRSNTVKSYVLRFNDSQVMYFSVDESRFPGLNWCWCAAIEKDNTTTVIQRLMVEDNQKFNFNGRTLLLGLFEDEKDKEIIKFIINAHDIVSAPRLKTICALVEEDTHEIASPAMTSREIIGYAIKRHELLSNEYGKYLGLQNIDEDIKEYLNKYKLLLIQKAKNESDAEFEKKRANYSLILHVVKQQLLVMDSLFKLPENQTLPKRKVVNCVSDNSVLTDAQKDQIRQAVRSLKDMFTNHLSTVLFSTDSAHSEALLAKYLETEALYRDMREVIVDSYCLGKSRDNVNDDIAKYSREKDQLSKSIHYYTNAHLKLVASALVFTFMAIALATIMPGSVVLTLAAPILLLKYSALMLSAALAIVSMLGAIITNSPLNYNRFRSAQVDAICGKSKERKGDLEKKLGILKSLNDEKLNKTITIITEKHDAIGREKVLRAAANDGVGFFSRTLNSDTVLPKEKTEGLTRRHSFSL